MCCHRLCYFLLFVFIFFNTNKNCLGTADFRSPSPEFHKHSIVRPILLHGRTKREILTTEHTNGEHHPEIHVNLPIAGEQWVLELKLNEDLLADGHTLQYEHGGKIIKHLSQKEELNLCHYSGSVRGRAQSWAAVSTCRGVRGVIFDGRAMMYLEPAEDTDSKTLHYLYHQKDLIMDPFRGGSVQHDPEMNRTDENDYISEARSSQRHEQGYSGRNQTRHKRATESIKLREPFHPDPTPRYLELVLVADKRQFEASGRDVRAVQATMIELANIVNSMFTPLNIYITLVAVVVWSERDKIKISRDADSTMRRFLSLDSVTTTPYDNAFLITHMHFDNGVVGRAHISQLCRSKLYNGLAGGIVVNHTDNIGLVASTLAHELGHNFGMKHDADCTINYCPDEHCIMISHTMETMQSYWSECSLKALKVSFQSELDYCLHNKPKRFLNRLGPKCGNGMTETGEQCDCGSTVYGGLTPCHACCDPDTCMLRQNATCAGGGCCDLKTCRLKSAGVVCRPAEGACDLPEYCSGDLEHCPRNVYKMDSSPCRVGKDQSYCMRGTCRSRHSQCQYVWGANVSSHDECYAVKNPSGNLYGNCGYDHSTSTYKSCKKEDAPCGLLQCHTDNKYYGIVLGIAKYYDIRTPLSSYTRKDSKATKHMCTTAAFNLYPDIADLGRVPDGASCGNEKMCLNQKCVPLKSVRERISRYASSVCPSDCSGHGICNSEGHCHCDNGYAPPLCASKGQGGSKDSGPASAKPGTESFDRPSGKDVPDRPYLQPTRPSYIPRTTYRITPKTISSTTPRTIPSFTPRTIPSFTPRTTPRTTPRFTLRTIPSFTPRTIPSYTPRTIPSFTPRTIPSFTTRTIPSYTPRTIPSFTPRTIPSYTPRTIPSFTPRTIPSFTTRTIPTFTPRTTPKTTPSFTPRTIPSFTPRTIPSYTPRTIPSFTPRTIPSFTTRTIPTFTPRTTPKTTPSFTPRTIPSFTTRTIPTFTPRTTPKTTPSFTPRTIPSFTPRTIPSYTPRTIPSFTPRTIPSFTTRTIPTFTPRTTPKTTPSFTPRTIPSFTPRTIPSFTPRTTPRTTPSFTPRTIPSFTPRTIPSFTPRTLPSFTPRTIPSFTSRTTPRTTPKTTPRTTYRTTPRTTASVVTSSTISDAKPSGSPVDVKTTTSLDEREILKILMYVLFLGIIPSIILLLLLLYYSRNGVLWKQMKNTYYLCCAKCSCNEMTENRKFVENVSEINKDIDLITDNDSKVTNSNPTKIKMPSLESGTKEPMLNLVDDKIQIETNDRKSYPAELSHKNTNYSQHAVDNVKLKSVKPAEKNNTNHDHTQNMIKNVKLRPIVQKLIQTQESKDCNDDDQIGKMAMDLKKLKPFSPKTVNTPLMSVSSKDEGIFYIRPETDNKHVDTHFPIQNPFLKPVKKANNNNDNTSAQPRTDFNAKSEIPPQKSISKPMLPVSHINKQFPKNMTKNSDIKNDDIRDNAPVKSLVSLFEPEIKSTTPGFQPNLINVKPEILRKPATKPVKPYKGEK